MTGFYTTAVTRTAKKVHKCSYCAEDINKGDSYEYQDGNSEGRWFKTRMHQECFEDMCEQGDGEYTPYSNERPKKEAA